ncbi:flagellar biosynthesis anti-sigma factor FlgM [Vibrio lentus]|nr:flagellar biosynthesis anti-sigma factor FlgM [Vibrio lentus]
MLVSSNKIWQHNQALTRYVKVAAISMIANGSYTVDPEKLADNMIKFGK